MPPVPMTGRTFWFDRNNYQTLSRYRSLSEHDKNVIDGMAQEGCYLFKNALDPAHIEQINDAIDAWTIAHAAALAANKKPDGTHPRLIGLHQELPLLQQLFASDIARRVQLLLAGRISTLFTTITFLQSSQQPLHRDIPVFSPAPGGFFFRMGFALEKATTLNGALTGVKGGHKIAAQRHTMPHRFYRHFDAIAEQDPDAWREAQEQYRCAYKDAGLVEETIEMESGDVLLWHPLFPHSGGNFEDKQLSRRSVVLHLSFF